MLFDKFSCDKSEEAGSHDEPGVWFVVGSWWREKPTARKSTRRGYHF
jgi:hypothetical protein